MNEIWALLEPFAQYFCNLGTLYESLLDNFYVLRFSSQVLLNFYPSDAFQNSPWLFFSKFGVIERLVELRYSKKNIDVSHDASYEDWTHDRWFTRPALYHWAKGAHNLMALKTQAMFRNGTFVFLTTAVLLTIDTAA